MTTSKVLERKDVPPESRWNDKAAFASWDEWSAEADALAADLPQLSRFEGALTQDSTVISLWSHPPSSIPS